MLSSPHGQCGDRFSLPIVWVEGPRVHLGYGLPVSEDPLYGPGPCEANETQLRSSAVQYYLAKLGESEVEVTAIKAMNNPRREIAKPSLGGPSRLLALRCLALLFARVVE